MRVVPVLLGVVVLIGAAEAGSAVLSGNRFSAYLTKLNGKDIGSPQLRLDNVQVQQGLFSSSATADLDIAGRQNLVVPLVLHASQGLRPDGSTLRLNLSLGSFSDPQVRAMLARVHDTQPLDAQADFGLLGKLRELRATFHPVHAVVDERGSRLDWNGASMVVHSHGYFGSGGSVQGSMRWTPMQIDVAQPAGDQVHIGEFDEDVAQNGRLNNSRGTVSASLGPTYARVNGTVLRLDSCKLSMQYALHRRESGSGDNPSGLPVGYVSFQDLRFTAGISQPVAGRIEATGKLQMPDVASSVVPGMTAQQIEAANLQALTKTAGRVQLRVSLSLYRKFQNPLLQQLAQSGYIVQQGQDVVSDISLAGGRITVNGHLLGF